ncbi:DNA polymerase domain-containing protein [Opitutus terrae]|uniref:DNA-directed DNA polymerase n=1 Tax=Opitutus terrae (strain DSM 11246 / JCM 15787 / PB90-1) TaxID=452637 RepID=B1ZW66_OPITP|nr:DNA polymerase domain-containing protein [Opitutus terrae]ACB76080.1 DNA polymerase B region [Opitutus terrae PB90-1]
MTKPEQPAGSLCGVWVDDAGKVHTTVALPDGGRETRMDTLRPFAWLNDTPPEISLNVVQLEKLEGEGPFNRLIHAEDFAGYDAFLRQARETVGVDSIRPLESQYLLQYRQRLYRDLMFHDLRRCQLDIETRSSDDGFCDPARPDDRVLAIGLRCGGHNRLLILEEMTDAAEKKLMEQLNHALAHLDPDVIEGHNIFKFDLDYLRQRCRRFKVPCAWGRYGQKATFRNSRLKVAERWIDFLRCDLPGRAVVDTYLLVQLFDITTRELTSYGLKEVAVYFGITEEDSLTRTYIEGHRIKDVFASDRARFRAYLEDDLRETEGLAAQLLPTYFEQVRTFPALLQEATLRGATSKIDLLFLEEYYHARQACPLPPEVRPFEGGYTRSFHEGVFRHVLHFDVASLYPSLLLHIGRNPKNDTLGVFIPLLRRLREYRLQFKQIARTSPNELERAEAQARQTNFKILINSFYGYLGFSGARFGDGELAAEVTRRGRELLQTLIDEFAKHGCKILEADTDGIYLSSEHYYEKPEELLALVATILPPGIELEHDGSYRAMWCYKAKNYALFDGQRVILRGSALRSRGIEPYLKKLSDQLINYLVGASEQSPLDTLEDYRKRLALRAVPVEELAKSETLGQNPDAYARFIEQGGKPRRAAAEAALQMTPRPRMGDRVSYYVTARTKTRTNDWQRARPLALYEPESAPYDPSYYIEKLDDWLTRYGAFLGVNPAAAEPTAVQGELF